MIFREKLLDKTKPSLDRLKKSRLNELEISKYARGNASKLIHFLYISTIVISSSVCRLNTAIYITHKFTMCSAYFNTLNVSYNFTEKL